MKKFIFAIVASILCVFVLFSCSSSEHDDVIDNVKTQNIKFGGVYKYYILSGISSLNKYSDIDMDNELFYNCSCRCFECMQHQYDNNSLYCTEDYIRVDIKNITIHDNYMYWILNHSDSNYGFHCTWEILDYDSKTNDIKIKCIKTEYHPLILIKEGVELLLKYHGDCMWNYWMEN